MFNFARITGKQGVCDQHNKSPSSFHKRPFSAKSRARARLALRDDVRNMGSSDNTRFARVDLRNDDRFFGMEAIASRTKR